MAAIRFPKANGCAERQRVTAAVRTTRTAKNGIEEGVNGGCVPPSTGRAAARCPPPRLPAELGQESPHVPPKENLGHGTPLLCRHRKNHSSARSKLPQQYRSYPGAAPRLENRRIDSTPVAGSCCCTTAAAAAAAAGESSCAGDRGSSGHTVATRSSFSRRPEPVCSRSAPRWTNKFIFSIELYGGCQSVGYFRSQPCRMKATVGNPIADPRILSWWTETGLRTDSLHQSDAPLGLTWSF